MAHVSPARPSPLPRSAPSDEGVDAAGILRFVEALEASDTQEPHGLMVLRHGRVVASGWWAPYGPDRPHLLYSLSKSFTSAAAGLLVDDGTLHLDDPVLTYFPELDDGITAPRTRRLLVRHLASMSSGHTEDMYLRAFRGDAAEPVRGFLRVEPDEEPGSVFAYNQPCTYTLGAIVQRLTGTSLVAHLRARLLDPIGAGPVSWQQHPAGRDLGFSGMFATTDTVARLGQLLLQRGRWGDRQVLSQEWVRQATSVQVATPVPFTSPAEAGASDSDWQQGYGFQHWMSRHGFRGDGAIGQFCVVLPEHDVVVALQGQAADMQETLDLLWEHLLPALEGPGTPDADRALTEHLDAAALPAPAAGRAPDASAWQDVLCAVAGGGRCVDQPSLRAIRVEAPRGHDTASADVRLHDSGLWRLTLVDTGGDITAGFAPGTAGWQVTGPDAPVAVGGGMDPDGRLRLDVAFLESPHRLQLTLEQAASGATFEAHWVVAPVRFTSTPLRDLAAPRPLG